jgi:hypothetical protein
MKSLNFWTGTIASLLLSWSASGEAQHATGTPASSTKIQDARKKEAAIAADSDSPVEKANTKYMFVGARFRYVIVPKFYMNLFVQGGKTLGVPALGPEFTIRKDDFEYVLSLMYASYAMDPTPFKSKTDPDQAWELVDTSIKALYLMSDFTWSTPIDPKFSIIYGAGFGLGLIFGALHRNQAYPGSGGAGDPYSYRPCLGPGNPSADFCSGADNNHFNNFSEPSWTNGGSKPVVFPWVSLQTGLRFKPSKHIMARLDIGWNIFNGPFFGLAGNYGL